MRPVRSGFRIADVRSAVDHGDAGPALGGFAEMLIASRAIVSTSENP
jgi:hypothetical protein